jgi:hypothetical protein
MNFNTEGHYITCSPEWTLQYAPVLKTKKLRIAAKASNPQLFSSSIKA